MMSCKILIFIKEFLFIKFIPGYLSFSDASVNGIASLISLYSGSLLVHRNAIVLCVLTFLAGLLVEHLEFYMHIIVLSADSDNLPSFL